VPCPQALWKINRSVAAPWAFVRIAGWLARPDALTNGASLPIRYRYPELGFPPSVQRALFRAGGRAIQVRRPFFWLRLSCWRFAASAICLTVLSRLRVLAPPPPARSSTMLRIESQTCSSMWRLDTPSLVHRGLGRLAGRRVRLRCLPHTFDFLAARWERNSILRGQWGSRTAWASSPPH